MRYKMAQKWSKMVQNGTKIVKKWYTNDSKMVLKMVQKWYKNSTKW